jgi:hypothetical protein
MSVDPRFAGVYDRGVMGRRGGLKDWFKGTPDTGKMGSTPVDPDAKEALRAEFFKAYNPTQYIDPKYLADKNVVDEINKRHSALFDSIVELNREQAEKGVPMYAINPAENLLHRLDSGYKTIASTQGARDVVAKMARLRPGSRFAQGGDGPSPVVPPGGPDPNIPPIDPQPMQPNLPGVDPAPPVQPVVNPINVAPQPGEFDEIDQLLQKIDGGGAMPAIVTNNLRKLAAQVGVDVDVKMKPRDVIEKIRQARNPSAQPIAELPPVAKPKTAAEIRFKPVTDWDEDDIKIVSDPEQFRSISPAHKKLDEQLDKLVKKRGILPEDATINRLLWAQSDLPYLPDRVDASRGMKLQFGRKASKSAAGVAQAARSQAGIGEDLVVLRSATKDSRTRGATSEGTRVLLHEMAHIIWFQAKAGGNADHKSLVEEFRNLANPPDVWGTVPIMDDEFVQEFLQGGNTLEQARYHAGLEGINSGSKAQPKEIERFAEFFAHSALRRRTPDGSKLGKLVEGSMQWLKDMLIKLGAVKGLDSKTRKRLDEIMDELGGFNITKPSAAAPTSVSDSMVDQMLGSKSFGEIQRGIDPIETQAAMPSKPIIGDSGSAFNLFDQVDQMGMNYDEGKAALLKSIGPEADRIIGIMEGERADSAAQSLSEIFQKAMPDDPIDDDDLMDALMNDRDSIRAIIGEIDDEELARKAMSQLNSLDKPINPDDVLREFEVDAEIGQDIANVNKSFSGPEEATAAAAAWDAVTNLFKGSVTAPFPSFHVRNAMSAFTQNALNGIHDPTHTGWKKYAQPYMDAKDLMSGKAIKDASKIPLFQRQGLDDKQATEEIRRLIFSRKLVDSPGDHNDIVGNLGGNVADQLIGSTPFKERIKRPEGVSMLDSVTPWKTPGVSGGENAFAPIRVGRVVGDVTEQAVRSAPFIALLKQGVDPDEAARMVKRLHVDYTDMTDVERKRIRRAVPFYGFTKGSTKYLASELAQKPGGAVAMSIKGAENASGDDPGAPAYSRSGMNIPIGSNAEGGQEYLVGAGLMHEPPMQMIGPTIPSTLFNVASVLHPAIKLPIELATNESLFQEGPDGGGRSIDDMDPLLGRTLSNIANTTGLSDREAPYRIPGGKLAESMISNSPVARLLHQVRKATDPRKSLTTKAIDGLTGFKIATVDPEDSDAVLREQAEQLMRELGGRDFSHAYIPDSVMATLEGEELAKAQQLQELLKLLNNRQRARRNAGD